MELVVVGVTAWTILSVIGISLVRKAKWTLPPIFLSAAAGTKDARGSMINVGLPFGRVLPTPDASMDKGDRQMLAYAYSGILAGGAAPAAPIKSERWVYQRLRPYG